MASHITVLILDRYHKFVFGRDKTYTINEHYHSCKTIPGSISK